MPAARCHVYPMKGTRRVSVPIPVYDAVAICFSIFLSLWFLFTPVPPRLPIWGSYTKPLGGCQNYGPFLGTLNIRGRITIGTPKRTIILTTTQNPKRLVLQVRGVTRAFIIFSVSCTRPVLLLSTGLLHPCEQKQRGL